MYQITKEHNDDSFKWLQEWYLSQCEEDDGSGKDLYQEAYGVRIDTLDNPGWHMEIDLKLTPLRTKPFSKLYVDNDEPEDGNDWYTCYVEDEVFRAACGPLHLGTVIGIFKKWATETPEDALAGGS